MPLAEEERGPGSFGVCLTHLPTLKLWNPHPRPPACLGHTVVPPPPTPCRSTTMRRKTDVWAPGHLGSGRRRCQHSSDLQRFSVPIPDATEKGRRLRRGLEISRFQGPIVGGGPTP